MYTLTSKLSRNHFVCGMMLRSNFTCDHMKGFNSIIFLCPHTNSKQKVAFHAPTHLTYA